MRYLPSIAIATAVAVTAQAAYVPGKAFDRFITIWLENQVCLVLEPLKPYVQTLIAPRISQKSPRMRT